MLGVKTTEKRVVQANQDGPVHDPKLHEQPGAAPFRADGSIRNLMSAGVFDSNISRSQGLSDEYGEAPLSKIGRRYVLREKAIEELIDSDFDRETKINPLESILKSHYMNNQWDGSRQRIDFEGSGEFDYLNGHFEAVERPDQNHLEFDIGLAASNLNLEGNYEEVCNGSYEVLNEHALEAESIPDVADQSADILFSGIEVRGYDDLTAIAGELREYIRDIEEYRGVEDIQI
jgi:hypothetical protein